MRRLIPILLVLIILCAIISVFVLIPIQVERNYGPPSPRLSLGQRYQFALRLFWHGGLLIAPSNSSDRFFTVDAGESPIVI
ncbi:MAG: hypothetical protein KJZ57_01950, partial [Anaerolineales bacterium]|nr:hypothetical protein [Anaerolineales bacterium]